MTTATPASMSTEAWLAAVQTLAPSISAYRDQSERERRMARPLFDAIRDSGIIQMLVPRAFGGPEATYAAYLRVIEEIARYDGAAGWNVRIWAAEGLFADHLDEHTAQKIFGGDTKPIIAGAISPTGRATQASRGSSVTRRWSFASGCHYATWLIAGCVVHDLDGAPVIKHGT